MGVAIFDLRSSESMKLHYPVNAQRFSISTERQAAAK